MTHPSNPEKIKAEILHLLKKNNFPFEHLHHEMSSTSADSAKAAGIHLSQGIKSIILRGKSSQKNYLFNVPSHLKLDMKAIAAAVGERCEFETPEMIQTKFGLTVGAIPPIGELLHLDTFFDEEIKANEKVVFSLGLHTESICMASHDLVALVKPTFGFFTQ